MSTLLHRLSEEIALLQLMLDLLHRESEAVTRQQYDQLPELARRKDKVAERLAACDRQREAQLQALGCTADRSGADAAAAREGPATQQAWARLLDLARQARALNHRNGVVVHAHLDHTRQSIAFLQTGGRPLYGPNGQHSAGRGLGVRYAAG